MTPLRPAEFSQQLLQAMAASEGRRRRRKRDTTPDRLGLDLKLDLLRRAAEEDPAPEAFEAWLLTQVLMHGNGGGALRALALQILHEYQMATLDPSFRDWLAVGAPSDDAEGKKQGKRI